MKLRAIAIVAIGLAAVPALAADKEKDKAKAPPAAASDPVIARVNGADIHRSDALELLQTLPPQARQQPQDKLYPMLLENLVANQLVAQAARKAKTQDEPEVKKRLALLQDQVIADAYLQRFAQKGVTEAKLQAAYDKYVKNAPPREEVNARHILVASEADARGVIEELKKGADFATLAKEKTTDPAGKASGGDLGWFTKADMVPDFAEAAFKLQKGEFTTTPVKTQFGWHVIKVEDRRVAKAPTFDEVKQQLTQQVGREIVQERLKELRDSAKIEVFNADGSKPQAAAPPPAQGQGQPPSQPLPPGASVPGAPTLAPATKE